MKLQFSLICTGSNPEQNIYTNIILPLIYHFACKENIYDEPSIYAQAAKMWTLLVIIFQQANLI